MIIGIIFAYLYLLLYFRVENTGNQYESLQARKKETKDKKEYESIGAISVKNITFNDVLYLQISRSSNFNKTCHVRYTFYLLCYDVK